MSRFVGCRPSFLFVLGRGLGVWDVRLTGPHLATCWAGTPDQGPYLITKHQELSSRAFGLCLGERSNVGLPGEAKGKHPCTKYTTKSEQQFDDVDSFVRHSLISICIARWPRAEIHGSRKESCEHPGMKYLLVRQCSVHI